MLQQVAVGRWAIASYEDIAPGEVMAELRERAATLSGARTGRRSLAGCARTASNDALHPRVKQDARDPRRPRGGLGGFHRAEANRGKPATGPVDAPDIAMRLRT